MLNKSIDYKIKEKVKEYIKRNKLLEKSDSVILGISGGADSVSMLCLLNELKNEFNLKLTAVHINHNIREEAYLDEKYVADLCEKLGVKCYTVQAYIKDVVKETKKSEEEAGRDVRYQNFYEIAKEEGANKIAVAHNKEDSVETVLFNMFRGSGLSGITGIAPKRKFRDLTLIRPVLCLNREEIEAYLKEKNIDFCTDKTNNETDYSRNKIRLELLPYIEKNINAGAINNISHMTEHLRETEDYLESQCEIYKDKYIRGNTIIEEGFKLHSAVFKKMVLELVHSVDGYVFNLDESQINAVADLRYKNVSKKVDLPSNLVAVRTYQGIEIRKKGTPQNTIEEVEIDISNIEKSGNISGFEFQIMDANDVDKAEVIKDLKCTKYLDYDKIHTLTLRGKRTGDFISIGENKTQKLKKFFVNNKISSEKSQGIYLLCDQSHVIWIVGHRISSYYKVSEETKKILKISYKKDKADN